MFLNIQTLIGDIPLAYHTRELYIEATSLCDLYIRYTVLTYVLVTELCSFVDVQLSFLKIKKACFCITVREPIETFVIRISVPPNKPLYV